MRAGRSRKGGAGETSGSKGASSSLCRQRAVRRSRSRSRDGRGCRETEREYRGLASPACCSWGAEWAPLRGACGRRLAATQKGLWVVAAGAVGVCMHLGARLGRRGAWGALRLRAYLMQHWVALVRAPISGMWEKKDSSWRRP